MRLMTRQGSVLLLLLILVALAAPLTALATVKSRAASDVPFGGAHRDVESLIAHYNGIRLSADQERLKAEALSGLPAPCCKQYTLATCCCPCNMAKAAWGLAAWLITEKGYDIEQIRTAEAEWLDRVNPDGFTGDACFTGGCSRPMRNNGCGGMKEDAILR